MTVEKNRSKRARKRLRLARKDKPTMYAVHYRSIRKKLRKMILDGSIGEEHILDHTGGMLGGVGGKKKYPTGTQFVPKGEAPQAELAELKDCSTSEY